VQDKINNEKTNIRAVYQTMSQRVWRTNYKWTCNMKNVVTVTADDVPELRRQRAEEVQPFAALKIADVQDRDENRRWLVENIWPTEGVGIVASSPKVGKTWITLEIGFAVASGQPFLGHYRVPDSGPVLIYNAEDRLADLKMRLAGICRARQLKLAHLNLYIIDSPTVVLIRPSDFVRLAATVRQFCPKLLILDPFVRMFRGSENDAGIVSRVLSQLRLLQRQCNVAILVAHHVRKRDTPDNGGANIRGSSDFHAWGDASFLLRRRRQDQLVLRVEHRMAASPDPIFLKLTGEPDAHLALDHAEKAGDTGTSRNDLDDTRGRAVAFIQQCGRIGREELRRHLGVRSERVGEVLEELRASGLIVRDGRGWVAVPRSLPVAPDGRDGNGGGEG
jgi:AAA domain-containing protein